MGVAAAKAMEEGPEGRKNNIRQRQRQWWWQEQRRRRHHLSNTHTQRSSKVLSLQLSRQTWPRQQRQQQLFLWRRQQKSGRAGGQKAGTGLEHARHPGTDWRFVEIIIEMKISMMWKCYAQAQSHPPPSSSAIRQSPPATATSLINSSMARSYCNTFSRYTHTYIYRLGNSYYLLYISFFCSWRANFRFDIWSSVCWSVFSLAVWISSQPRQDFCV